LRIERASTITDLGAMSIIGILRQNNPATTCVGIHLDDESSGADLAEALEQNPFVTSISLDLLLGDEQWPDWSSLELRGKGHLPRFGIHLQSQCQHCLGRNAHGL